MRMQGPLFRLSDDEPVIAFTGRAPGADTDAVLAELGYAPGEIDALRAERVDRVNVPLTALYVPGDRPDRWEKAIAAGADVVIIDLEDAVAPSSQGRGAERASPRSVPSPGTALQVRINARGTAWHDADLDAVAALPADVGVRVPEGPVGRTRSKPSRRTHRRPRDPRSHRVRARGRARVRDRVGRSRHRSGSAKRTCARSSAWRAAPPANRGCSGRARASSMPPRPPGIAAPMMSVYADVADVDGLAASCASGRALGFVGRTAIHPAQLADHRGGVHARRPTRSRAPERSSRVSPPPRPTASAPSCSTTAPSSTWRWSSPRGAPSRWPSGGAETQVSRRAPRRRRLRASTCTKRARRAL